MEASGSGVYGNWQSALTWLSVLCGAVEQWNMRCADGLVLAPDFRHCSWHLSLVFCFSR